MICGRKRMLAAYLGLIMTATRATVCHGFARPGQKTNALLLDTTTLLGRKQSSHSRPLFLSSRSNEIREDEERALEDNKQQQPYSSGDKERNASKPDFLQSMMESIQEYDRAWRRRPPIKVEDMNVLLYDIFLLVNLSVSISFWVVHRMDVDFIGSAFNEGCLMSLLWMAAGLFSGAFLYSAVDGHFTGPSAGEKGGPQAAGMLAFQTFVNAVNLRLLFALAVAVLQHRPVGSAVGEQIMPMEIGFGLLMMSTWRILHSSFVPRI